MKKVLCTENMFALSVFVLEGNFSRRIVNWKVVWSRNIKIKNKCLAQKKEIFYNFLSYQQKNEGDEKGEKEFFKEQKLLFFYLQNAKSVFRSGDKSELFEDVWKQLFDESWSDEKMLSKSKSEYVTGRDMLRDFEFRLSDAFWLKSTEVRLFKLFNGECTAPGRRKIRSSSSSFSFSTSSSKYSFRFLSKDFEAFLRLFSREVILLTISLWLRRRKSY